MFYEGKFLQFASRRFMVKVLHYDITGYVSDGGFTLLTNKNLRI